MAETMGPPDKQQHPQQPQHQHGHKKRFKKWKHFRDREHGGEGGGGGQPQHQGQPRGFRRPANMQAGGDEVVTFDFNTFPADLDAPALAALAESLPPAAKKKPKPALHVELQQKNLADLFEVAEAEGVEIQGARNRRDVIFEITAARLRNQVPVVVEGVVALQGPHAMLRSSCYDYMPAQDDVVIPASVVKECSLVPGMTVRGRLRAAREGEKHFALVEVDEIDSHPPEEAKTRAPFKELTPLY